MSSSAGRRSVGILAFDAMEVLDHAGPFEVFGVAGELSGDAAFEVRSIGVGPGPITARGGFKVVPDEELGASDLPDVLLVPGGQGSRALLADGSVLAWLRDAAGSCELVASVCTGALVLAAAGLLEDAPATTHHSAFQDLRDLSPSTTVVEGERFVQSSPRIWTSAGVSAGVDLSLHLVELLAGPDLRRAVATEMEWGW